MAHPDAEAVKDRLDRNTVHEHGCWIWTGYTTPSGYGQVRWRGPLWRVHRLAYHHLVEYLPKDKAVHHRCANPSCWRPEHLQATDHQDNLAEMMARNGYQDRLLALAQAYRTLLDDAFLLAKDRSELQAQLDDATHQLSLLTQDRHDH